MLIHPVRHRIPPKPPWMKAKPKGTCQWCREPIYPGQRQRPRSCNWHHECLCEYRSIFDWQYIRQKVFDRDHGLCQHCGQELYSIDYFLKRSIRIHHDYEVDHIKPLFSWPKQDITLLTWDNLPLWYAPWQMQNLNTLCPKCHRDKTIRERKTKPIVRRQFAWQRFK